MKKFRLVKYWHADHTKWKFRTQCKYWWWPWWVFVGGSETDNLKDAQEAYVIIIANRGGTTVLAKEP
jgi:hypothetical protein